MGERFSEYRSEKMRVMEKQLGWWGKPHPAGARLDLLKECAGHFGRRGSNAVTRTRLYQKRWHSQPRGRFYPSTVWHLPWLSDKNAMSCQCCFPRWQGLRRSSWEANTAIIKLTGPATAVQAPGQERESTCIFPHAGGYKHHRPCLQVHTRKIYVHSVCVCMRVSLGGWQNKNKGKSQHCGYRSPVLFRDSEVKIRNR